jgi:hypothetical protein
MPYVLPQNVTAPKGRWTLHRILIAGKVGRPAYALGTWDGERCIGARWNGTDDNEIGWPRIYTRPCWHILDEDLYDGVLALLPNYTERILAMRFLNGENV